MTHTYAREKLNAYYRDYWKRHPEKYLLHSNKIKAKRNYRYDTLRHRAERKGTPLTFTLSEFINWYGPQSRTCHYCKRPYTDTKPNNDSVDRKDNNIGYTINNIVLCCYRCNIVKNVWFSYSDMVQIGETIARITPTTTIQGQHL